mgnify:CR=1 FL=1
MDVETMRKEEAAAALREAHRRVDAQLRAISRDAESPTDMMWDM